MSASSTTSLPAAREIFEDDVRIMIREGKVEQNGRVVAALDERKQGVRARIICHGTVQSLVISEEVDIEVKGAVGSASVEYGDLFCKGSINKAKTKTGAVFKHATAYDLNVGECRGGVVYVTAEKKITLIVQSCYSDLFIQGDIETACSESGNIICSGNVAENDYIAPAAYWHRPIAPREQVVPGIPWPKLPTQATSGAQDNSPTPRRPRMVRTLSPAFTRGGVLGLTPMWLPTAPVAFFVSLPQMQGSPSTAPEHTVIREVEELSSSLDSSSSSSSSPVTFEELD
jgi:hypothetical protein